MADSIPYGRQIVYYSSKAALPTLTALIFLASVGELFVQFLQWFLPLLGEGMYRAHRALERSQYVDPIWRDSAPIVEAEPFEWPDPKAMVAGWWRAVISRMKRCLATVEGLLDKMEGGGGSSVMPYRAGGEFGGGGAVVKARVAPTRSATTPIKQVTPPRPPRRIASSSSSKPTGSVKSASVGSLGSGRGLTSNPFAAQRNSQTQSDRWDDEDDRGSVWSGEGWDRA